MSIGEILALVGGSLGGLAALVTAIWGTRLKGRADEAERQRANADTAVKQSEAIFATYGALVEKSQSMLTAQSERFQKERERLRCEFDAALEQQRAIYEAKIDVLRMEVGLLKERLSFEEGQRAAITVERDRLSVRVQRLEDAWCRAGMDLKALE